MSFSAKGALSACVGCGSWDASTASGVTGALSSSVGCGSGGALSASGVFDGASAGSKGALSASGGKRAYASLVPSNQAHQTIGSPPAVPILVTVMSGPPDFS